MTDGSRPRWGLVVHGGAGAITRDDLRPEQEEAYREAMATAAQAGAAVLRAGGLVFDGSGAEADATVFENIYGRSLTADDTMAKEAAGL